MKDILKILSIKGRVVKLLVSFIILKILLFSAPQQIDATAI